MKVDNAIILAAGTASRFAPLSYELPKALITVRGEILIERQIRQLQESGINQIIVVTGYQAEKFNYLIQKYNVTLVHNPDYLHKNNHSSIWAVRHFLKNSYICSSDNYFLVNPFEKEVDESYYSAVFAKGKTKEWCIEEKEGYISNVSIGGKDSWIMLGHVFWSESFSHQFLKILGKIYDDSKIKDDLWELIYIKHINKLPMKIRKYPDNMIFEFDTLDELRMFDSSYFQDTKSTILRSISKKLDIKEEEITRVIAVKDEHSAAKGFKFEVKNSKYYFEYETRQLEEIR